MSGGSSGGSTNTVQKSDPWSGQQPFLIGGTNSQGQTVPGVFNEAANLYQNNTPQYYPQSTVAPLTPTQQLGLNLETAQGLNGAQSIGAADTALTKTLNGGYLDPNSNPFFQGMSKDVLASVVPNLESQFTAGGTMNSPGAAYAVGRGAASALGDLAYQNYNDQQTNMMRAAALAPGVQGAQYQNIQAVEDAGNQQQQQNQAELNDQIARFNFGQQLPYNQLATYENMIQGNYGGTSTLTQPYYQNSAAGQAAGALGGAASGAMVGSMFGPYGTAIGAVGGGLLGLFGS